MPQRPRVGKALALLAVGAAGVRLVYLLAFARDYTPRSDANHYQAIAKAFAQGDGIAGIFPFTYQHPTAFRPPLYPALLGAVYWVTGVHVGVGQLLNVALGVVVVVLAALLGAHIAGYRAGIAAGIVVGVYPPLLANDVVLLSEPLVARAAADDDPAAGARSAGVGGRWRAACSCSPGRARSSSWSWSRHGWSGGRAGGAAARFGAVDRSSSSRPGSCATGSSSAHRRVVTSNGFNLVSTYSERGAGHRRVRRTQCSTTDSLVSTSPTGAKSISTDAYRDHAIDAVHDRSHDPAARARAQLGTNYFEFRPDKNANAEERRRPQHHVPLRHAPALLPS